MEKIFLVGFMGSGKSTVGRMLAEKLGWKFVDLDRLIELQQSRRIYDIITGLGEEVFRQVEKQALHGVLGTERAVIATGGGTPVFFDNMTRMKESGFTVYLCCSLDTLEKRVLSGAGEKARPLARFSQDRDAMVKLLENRESYYRKAETVVVTDRIGPDQAAEKIAEVYHQWQKKH